MSYAFDVMSSVWSQHIRPHIPNEEIAMRFEMLFQTMHDANHEVSYSVFEGDGLNKHPAVTADARKLDELRKKLEEDDGPAETERKPSG